LWKSIEANCNTIIFEDDIKFINDAEHIIPQALDELSEIDWDMFYLGGNVLKPIYQKTNHLGKLTHSQSAHAYGVTPRGAEKLLRLINNNVDYPIDVIYAELMIPYCNAYMCIPIVAIQKDNYSDIEKKFSNYESYLEKRFWANLVKL
jgi:GR25 family glycosyltransferase involved in LPS biosynthesis